MQVRGITKVRNEAHIIHDTLDSWAVCCDAIHVYCDNCTDVTAELCRQHPVVKEVIESDLMDPDRERAEWYNREAVLASARRWLTEDDWLCYFDGDEQLASFDHDMLRRPEVDVIAIELYDSYITDEDKDLDRWDYRERAYVGDEYMLVPAFYRARRPLRYYRPDQRNIDIPSDAVIKVGGKLRHWGKGISVPHFDAKCDYYAETFGPKYADKWRKRKGHAVHSISDYGRPLVRWDDVLNGKVAGIFRNKLELVT